MLRPDIVVLQEEAGLIQSRVQRDTECQWTAAGVSESTLLLVGGVSAATRSNGYTTKSGQTSILLPLLRVLQHRKSQSRRMSYDAEKASVAAAFSEDSVRT